MVRTSCISRPSLLARGRSSPPAGLVAARCDPVSPEFRLTSSALEDRCWIREVDFMNGSNRVALVTGASRGLGVVIADVLADRGYDLVVGARGAEPLQQAADALAGRGTRVVAVAGDVTDAAVRARLVDAARALGGLDVLVNNASELGAIGPLMDFDVTRFG